MPTMQTSTKTDDTARVLDGTTVQTTDRRVPLVTRVTNGAPLFDDSPMGSLYDLTTLPLELQTLVDLTLYFELALN
jgi:hypothetical protein